MTRQSRSRSRQTALSPRPKSRRSEIPEGPVCSSKISLSQESMCVGSASSFEIRVTSGNASMIRSQRMTLRSIRSSAHWYYKRVHLTTFKVIGPCLPAVGFCPRGARIAYSLLESSVRKSRQGTFARFDSYCVWQAATTWRAVCRDVYCASTPILSKGFRSGGAA